MNVFKNTLKKYWTVFFIIGVFMSAMAIFQFTPFSLEKTPMMKNRHCAHKDANDEKYRPIFHHWRLYERNGDFPIHAFFS